MLNSRSGHIHSGAALEHWVSSVCLFLVMFSALTLFLIEGVLLCRVSPSATTVRGSPGPLPSSKGSRHVQVSGLTFTAEAVHTTSLLS